MFRCTAAQNKHVLLCFLTRDKKKGACAILRKMLGGCIFVRKKCAIRLGMDTGGWPVHALSTEFLDFEAWHGIICKPARRSLMKA